MWFALDDIKMKVGPKERSQVPMLYFMYQALTMVVADSPFLGHKNDFALLPLKDLYGWT